VLLCIRGNEGTHNKRGPAVNTQKLTSAILGVGVLLLNLSSAFAAGPLKGTFEGTGQSKMKVLRGLPKIPAMGRVRMSFSESGGLVTVHTTALASRIGSSDPQKTLMKGAPVESVTTGKILSDSTVSGTRRVRILFEGAENTAASQKALDAASLAAGMKPILQIKESTAVMDVVQHPNGTISVESSVSMTRGETKGLLNKVFMKRTVKSDSSYELQPVE